MEFGTNSDVPEFDDKYNRGEYWFSKQPHDLQLEILKPLKYELYQQGKFKLGDLVDYFIHSKYGPTRQERFRQRNATTSDYRIRQGSIMKSLRAHAQREKLC